MTPTATTPQTLESIGALESYAASLEARHADHLAEMGEALKSERERYATTRTVGSVTRGRSAGLDKNDNHYTHNVRDEERRVEEFRGARIITKGKRKGKLAKGTTQTRDKTDEEHAADALEILERATAKERESMDPRDTTMLADYHVAGELRSLADVQRRMLAIVEADDWAADETERDEARKTLQHAGREAHEMLAQLAESDPTSNEADGAEVDDRVKAIGYVRVSTREQGDNGHGLDAQEAQIREAAARKGWHLVTIERDVISTRKRSRPGLEAAIAQAREAGGVLLAAKASRIARGTVELIQLHTKALEEGWHILALDMEQLDTTTASGRMHLGIVAVFNEFERDIISERTREGLRAAKAKGVKIGRPVLGEGKKDTPEDRRRAEATIARLTSLRADGASFQAMSDRLNADGVPGFHGGTWHKQSVHQACRRYGIQ